MTEPWLSTQFIENAFKYSENDDSICIIDCYIESLSEKGDNYAGDMYRAFIEYTRSDSIKAVTEKKSIIIKVALTRNSIYKTIIEQASFFDREIKMMTTTLRDMQKLLKDTKLSGACYYVQEKDPSVLIIEDLTPLGFVMASRHIGLNREHCLYALRGLAKFHAASVAVCEKTPKYKDIYRRRFYDVDNHPVIAKCYFKGLKTLAKIVGTWSELGPKFTEKIDRMAYVAWARACAALVPDNSELNVINHGDYWINNMLFKYDNKGKVIDHILVDFQLCFYGSPAVDISYFFATSVTEEVFSKHKNELVSEYLKVLTSTMKDVGCKTSPPSMNELQNALFKQESCSFLTSCVHLPSAISKPDDCQNYDEILEQEGMNVNVKAYNSDAYKKLMIGRLIEWDAMGLFDI